MSIDYGIYVGPYVRCIAPVIDKEETIQGCTNTACVSYGLSRSQPYCYGCGAKVGDVVRTVRTTAINEWDVREELQEKLASPGGDSYLTWAIEYATHLWKPNIVWAWDGHLDSREDFRLVALPATIIADQMQEFVLRFADELSILYSIYGKEVVTVEWGIIQDYH